MAEKQDKTVYQSIPEPAKPVEPSITASQLNEILENFVKAIKEPSEKEKREIEAQRKIDQRLANERIVNSFKDMERHLMLAEKQQTCPHVKQDGANAFVGQVLSNNDVFVVCQKCNKEWAYQARGDKERMEGIEFQADWNRHVRAKDLDNLMAQHPPKSRIRRFDTESLKAEQERRLQACRERGLM